MTDSESIIRSRSSARGQVLSAEEAESHATAWYLDEAAIVAERTASTAPHARASIVVIVLGIAALLLIIGMALIMHGSELK